MYTTKGKRIKPKALQLGDTIGIIAPSGPVNPEKLERALAIFSHFGYNYKIGPSVYQQMGYLAGPDCCRADDLNQMFADPIVDAIFCVRGGYGATRILDRINYEWIQQNPKIFVGYSDITALHLAIQKKTGLVTFHGPMIAELADHWDPLSWTTLFRNLTETEPVGAYVQPEETIQYTITPGIAEGRLIGGNLCLLVSTLGTPYEVETKGKILFIEDVKEEPYRVDRMLTHLRSAGKLHEARGIVFTDFSRCDIEDESKSFTLRQVFEDIVQPLGIPAFYGLKAGHSIPNFTLPIGIKARMDATSCWLELIEGSVISNEYELIY